MGIDHYTIYDIIQRNALLFKDKVAWLEAGDNTGRTFAEIKNDVDCMAAALQKAGLGKGDRLGIVGKNCLAYFVLYGAAAALGAIVVPINWRLSAEEAAYNLNDTGPRIVFMESDTQEWLEAVCKQLPESTLFFNLVPGQGSLPDFDTGVPGAPFTPAEVGTDDGLVIIHTAAVAGRPRGALLSHGNLLHTNMHLLYCFNLAEKDVHLNLLPLFHVAGLCMSLVGFHVGALNVNLR
ncbi:MAG: AMP-binding protein, partial [Desulfosarcinaceae bacterium]